LNCWTFQPPATISHAPGFIVLAAASNGTGWGSSDDLAELQAFLADAFASYNIEESRVYLWGFSAGGHYGHWYALNHTQLFAAYGVSAGALQLYTCTDAASPNCATVLTNVPRKIPLDVHIGHTDPLYTNPQYDVKHDDDRFGSGGWIKGQDLFFVVFAGAHIYTIAQLGEIWNNLCPYAVGP
jgi:poly(3-hydroxybutyrate) depolymerase